MQASVGSHCVDCAKAARPDVRTRARYWNARQPTIVTYALIAASVLVFLYATIQESRSLRGSNASSAYRELALARFMLADDGEWWRLITSGFLHYGILHLGLNMYALYQLGQLLEPSLGRAKFAVVYVASLLGGSAGAVLFQPNGLHGSASGAVFGLFGLIAVGYLRRGVNPLSTSLGGVLIMNAFITFLLPSISWGGHLGGAVAGAACGFVVAAPRHRAYPSWVGYAVPAAVAALAVAVAVTVSV